MAGTQAVHDAVANRNETLEHHAEVLAPSKNRRVVFEEIYRGRGKPKTAKAIVASTGLGQKAVLGAGQDLVAANMASREETIEDGRKVIAFGKNEFCRHYRDRILRLAEKPDQRKALPTKRRPEGRKPAPQVRISLPRQLVRVRFITVDEIDSFKGVRGTSSNLAALPSLSENEFKKGIQNILGEAAEFKDWGGEKSDLMTTRLIINGRRCRAAFAFKGPGLKSKLVPGKMGKNGDQCQRLFSEAADVFIVHHWREIDSSVIELMRMFAFVKSVSEMREIIYGVMDGQDSNRIVAAYPTAFS